MNICDIFSSLQLIILYGNSPLRKYVALDHVIYEWIVGIK